MDIPIHKTFALDASVEQAWAVLGDIRAVAACMPGAEITEELDATHFKGTVKSRIGPATMSFAGTIEVLALDVAARTLEMLGKGADRGGSSASMKLKAHIEPGASPRESTLVGEATVSVSGKLAQFGNRLLVPVADAMLEQFAANFRAAASATPPPVPVQANDAGQAPMAGVAPVPPPPPAPVRELNVLALLWSIVRGRFRGLFGAKR